VQTQILAKYAKAPLQVYAVWFNMYPGDERAKWPPDLMTDSRVIHRWDEPKTAGTWYGQHAAYMRPQLTPESTWNGAILWDSYVLYSADARWDDVPSGVIHWGRTIVAGRETLKADIERLFGPKSSVR
jgi:hypothetical protein